MSMRMLAGALCLMAMVASGAQAQGPAPSVNSPPVDHPAIDGTAKAPDTATTIPDVVKPSAGYSDVVQPAVAGDSAAVLKPPNVDPGMRVAPPVPPDAARRAEDKAAPK